VKNKQKPEIQFEKNKENWKEIKAGSIFYSISDKNHPNLPVLSASQEKGMVFRDQIGIDIQYNIESTKTYKRVVPGQFVIHLRSFQGGFAFSTIEGITSPAYTILDFKNKEEQDVLFWKNVLSSKTFIKKLESVTYGIRDGRSISFNDFSTLKFVVPNYEAQKKIGSFFKNLDDTIALHQQELDALKKAKQSFLKKMFPENGENVPRIRFSKFTNNWEYKKVKNVISLLKDGTHGTHKDGEYAYLLSAKNIKFGKVLLNPDQDRKIAKIDYKQIYKNYELENEDLLVTIVGTIGQTALYYKDDNAIAFQRSVGIIRGNEDVSQLFLKAIFDSSLIQKQLKKSSSISAQPGVYLGDLEKMTLMLPTIDEQIKIGEFFKEMDEVIDLKEQELKALKQTKQGFLQKMFV